METVLFPTLKNLDVVTGNKRSIIIREIFEGTNNYMKNGTIIRQVLNELNKINFNVSEDRHVFGDIYGKILKYLQSAGNYGEFYTPRAITEFMTEMIDPRLGEKILDPACGTGGFLTSAIENIRKRDVKGLQDLKTLETHVHGMEFKRIVEEEQGGEDRAEYGAFIINELSKTLSTELGKGFSLANLKNFRQFFMTFPDFEKSYTLCSRLSWSQIRLIMRVESPHARKYYMEEAGKRRWSVPQLERNIKTFYFERLLSSKDKHALIEHEKVQNESTSRDFLKDPYILEFLDLSEDPVGLEKNLESAIIANLQTFLLEMGNGFSFISRQFRISTETSHFYIDLVFYHYILKCFVLIDLKTGKLTHQDIGQMDMYVRMVSPQ